jgi:hypothetical protein
VVEPGPAVEHPCFYRRIRARVPAVLLSGQTIACWFIDTAYDDQQFFVRHAYFLGADDPYAKLKRALRADIDEAAWVSLNSTVSPPFPQGARAGHSRAIGTARPPRTRPAW